LAESALARAGSDLVKSESETRQTSSDYAEALGSSSFQTEQESMLAAMEAGDRTQLDQAITDYEAECNNIKITLKAQQEQVTGKERQNLAALQETVTVALAEKNRLDAALSDLSKHLHTLDQVKTNFEAAGAAMEELEASYAVIGTLSDVANGQTGNKVSLQRFVLGVLLDDVLIQATQRLSSMSSGRYQLIRKGERSKGNKASGLDLMVYDDHSGTERSVATLSGGESFMAALSLALGLSDVVQSYAGGIRLDTLFVDEGFGSLDQESLELAIRTLIDLQESGRMVGVISHVTELKEQMEVRIDVEKGVKGSHLSVVAPDLVS
jgi:exonuclease SbcC